MKYLDPTTIYNLHNENGEPDQSASTTFSEASESYIGLILLLVMTLIFGTTRTTA